MYVLEAQAVDTPSSQHTLTPLCQESWDRELMALVECKATTVFDSAHLMLAANTDAVVGLLDGRRLTGHQLQEMFLRVRLAKDTVILPYIFAKSEQTFDALVNSYQAMKKNGGAQT